MYYIPEYADANPLWMARPKPLDNIPPGLEYLYEIDEIDIKQIPTKFESKIK